MKKNVNGEGTRVKVVPPGKARMPHLSPSLTYKQSILTQAAALGPVTHILTLDGQLPSPLKPKGKRRLIQVSVNPSCQ